MSDPKPKFNVGEKVRFIRSMTLPGTHPELNKIFTISSINFNAYENRFKYILEGFPYHLTNSQPNHADYQLELAICKCPITRLMLQGCNCGAPI